MNYKFEECHDLECWNDFVASSPQSNLFCFAYYLALVSDNFKLFFVLKDKKILAAVPILLDKKNNLIPCLESYQGILYSSDFEKLKSHSRVPKMLEVTEFLLVELSKLFSEYKLSLHYSIKDLRAFQWHNYHEEGQKRINIDLTYTCLLDLQKINNLDELISQLRRVRRREYNKALKNELIIEESDDITILDKLHEKMFHNQGIERSNYDVDCLKKISLTSIKKDFGKLYVCYTNQKVPCSAYLMLFDKNQAFSKYGATDPNFKNIGAFTYLTIHCIQKSIEFGLKKWDFLGANSPTRGDYKISFNPELVSFYQLSF